MTNANTKKPPVDAETFARTLENLKARKERAAQKYLAALEAGVTGKDLRTLRECADVALEDLRTWQWRQ